MISTTFMGLLCLFSIPILGIFIDYEDGGSSDRGRSSSGKGVVMLCMLAYRSRLLEYILGNRLKCFA